MQPSSQLVQRNSDQFESLSNLLIVNPPKGDSHETLKPSKVATVDYRVFQSLETALPDIISFGLEALSPGEFDAALVFVPKAKGELNILLSYACSGLKPGGKLFLVGAKKEGVASAAKQLDKWSDKVYKVDSAKHCQLWLAEVNDTAKPFDLADHMSSFSIEIDDVSRELATIPGVFSYQRLDLGTELLLSQIPLHAKKMLHGRVLDFGCGSGPIGITAKLLKPEIQLEMVDVNWLALECTKRSCALNKVDAKIYPSDGWGAVDGRVDAVLSNPPFHEGVSYDYQTSERFIQVAKDKMTKHAALMIVANGFLKYASVIEHHFGRCDVLVETTKFKVYKTLR